MKEQGRLLRQNEFLVWQGRGGKKSLRQVFLFEDLVLFSKARRFPDSKNLDIFLYKNSIKTSDIGLTAFVGDSTTKFEIWFRKRKPEDTWTLQSINEDIKNAWTEEVSKLLWQQAKRNRDIRMAEMSSMGIGNKPCLDIRPSQNQINDRSISFSQLEKGFLFEFIENFLVPNLLSNIEFAAPKFRNSFSGTMLSENTNTTQRPNSIISLGSSFSSGTSRSSLSSSTASSNSATNTRHTNNLNMELELINEALPLKTTTSKKYNRSTTLTSQVSMGKLQRIFLSLCFLPANRTNTNATHSQLHAESGIIADILTSPESETSHQDGSTWPSIYTKNKTKITQKHLIPNTNVHKTPSDDTDNHNSNTNPYVNNDSLAVHL